MSGFRVAKTRLLSVVRRGPSEVVWTPDFMGLGNLLYIALWVARDPSNRSMLRTTALDRWLPAFPALEELTVSRKAVGFTDVRRSAITQSYGSFGTDFSEGELEDFVTTYLLPSHPPRPSPTVSLSTSGAVTTMPIPQCAATSASTSTRICAWPSAECRTKSRWDECSSCRTGWNGVALV